jgi:hypothetical protein
MLDLLVWKTADQSCRPSLQHPGRGIQYKDLEEMKKLLQDCKGDGMQQSLPHHGHPRMYLKGIGNRTTRKARDLREHVERMMR